MEKQLEYRMYGLVPYNLSPIQQGIQFGHAVVEYMVKYRDLPNLTKWAEEDKTFIILNGGTTNKRTKEFTAEFIGSLNEHIHTLYAHDISLAYFEEPDLGDQLTAVVFLVDERVWDKETYPDFPPFEEGDLDGQTEDYLNWTDSIGGEKNVWLREFLTQFRFA